MPAITIQSLELRDDQKELMAERFTSLFSELTNVPKDRIYVFFDGYSLDNAAANGVLFAKNPPNRLIARFNDPAIAGKKE